MIFENKNLSPNFRLKRFLYRGGLNCNNAYHNNLRLVLFPVVDVLSISKDVTPILGVMCTCYHTTICQQYQLNLGI